MPPASNRNIFPIWSIRIVRLVAEQTGGLHSGDELLGGSIVVSLAFGDLKRERESERVDHHVDLRGEAAA
jgi:hypothetical protein